MFSVVLNTDKVEIHGKRCQVMELTQVGQNFRLTQKVRVVVIDISQRICK